MTLDEIKNIINVGEKSVAEFKEAKDSVPNSVYSSYSAFANTKGGVIVLGVAENKTEKDRHKKFYITGVNNSDKIITDFWNTINSAKVNQNILTDDNVYTLTDNDKTIVVIEVPRASYNQRPIYEGENPFKRTYKRNHEGDYHCTEAEVRAMIRDQNSDGNDSMILEGYTFDDIDSETFKHYRTLFQNMNPDHVWNTYDDKAFLEQLGGYRKDRRNKTEGLTLAGLMMYGKGLSIRDAFDNILMDFRDESNATDEIRWNDRITYDGTWENNLFNFFMKVSPKLTADLKKPFKLKGMQRIDDTPVHRAIREALVNMIIHADYLSEGTLKVIKTSDGIEFTNPGILKLPVEEIYAGGNSKTRNPRMQTMLRLVGFGDNAGSGFSKILSAWADEGWATPQIYEDTVLNQVKLSLLFKSEDGKNSDDTENVPENVSDNVPQNDSDIKLNDRQKALVNIIKTDKYISRVDIAKKLDVSIKTIARDIEFLKQHGIIERIGSSKSGYWKILSDN